MELSFSLDIFHEKYDNLVIRGNFSLHDPVQIPKAPFPTSPTQVPCQWIPEDCTLVSTDTVRRKSMGGPMAYNWKYLGRLKKGRVYAPRPVDTDETAVAAGYLGLERRTVLMRYVKWTVAILGRNADHTVPDIGGPWGPAETSHRGFPDDDRWYYWTVGILRPLFPPACWFIVTHVCLPPIVVSGPVQPILKWSILLAKPIASLGPILRRRDRLNPRISRISRLGPAFRLIILG